MVFSPIPAKKHPLQVVFCSGVGKIQCTRPQVKARTAALGKSKGLPRLGPALWLEESAPALPTTAAEVPTSMLGHCPAFL